ncbi:restriction endonuclease subunit S [Aerococcus urinaeequi]|uniref:restriction endonuclease subunit S n=1 Tax=Aerococcus urinaeequi TaxID=51665 RepID=UPI003B4B0997
MGDTVELMRKRVLDMAIRGELVEQRPEEGTALELLNAIEDKKKLVPVKRKVSSSSKNYDIPFKLPKSWEWTTLESLSSLITDGTHKTPTYVDEGVPFLSIKNISQGYLDLSDIKYITPEEHEELIRRCNPQKGDIMFCRIGTLGRVHLIEDDFEFSIFVSLGLIKLIEKDLGMYLKYMLSSPEFYRQVDEVKVVGSHASKLNLRDARNIKVPLPPIAEQKRIVAKIEEIFAVIDQIGTKKEEALSIIRNLRQTALQDAVMGVLVDQEDTNEPASILYEKIQAEKEQMVKEKKIKKEATLPDIEADEIPFDIPESWKWVRLGDIVSIKGGKRIPKGDKFSDVPTDYAYLRVSDMHNGTIIGDSLQYLTEEIYEKIKAYTITSADVYLTIAGTIGRVGLIPEEFSGMNLTENACKLTPVKVDKHYLMYGLYSNFVQNQFKEGVNQLAQPKLSIRTTRSTIFPLPPIAEQRRIVEKLDEIMAICDQMEAILDGSSETNKALKVAE